MLARAAAVVVLATIVGAGIVHGGASSAEPTVYQFLLAWEQGQYRQAAALTTGPQTLVAAELRGFYQQLDATSLVLSIAGVSQQGRTAAAEFNARIQLGSTGQEWAYSGQFGLRETGSTWRIIWSPAVIVPRLQAGYRLAVAQLVPARGQLLTASGLPLTVVSKTVEIGVYPSQLTGAAEVQQIAVRLSSVFHLQASQVAGEIEASPSRDFRELITLTPGYYDKVRGRLAGTPGLQVKSVLQPLFDSIAPDIVGSVGTENSAVLRAQGVPYQPGSTVGLSGLQQAFDRQLAGTPTSGVVMQDGRGVALYYLSGAQWPGTAGRSVTTTLDYGVQLAADGALAQLPASAAIVAVQANTGKILAVASHRASGMPALSPLAGRYRPGQAFTIVSGAAMLASGHVSPGGPQQCTARNSVNGVAFRNDPAEPASLAAPSTTVRNDFAAGCSTAFALLSEWLSAGDLTSAATEFGIGAPWQLPLPRDSYFSGAVGQPGGADVIAADAIGQGDVQVSPLSMALVAATADSGRWHAPSLIAGGPDPSVKPATTMSAQVLSELRGLMRDAVVHGSGSAADVGHSVYGQAGNAPFDKHLRISWFVGYQGNIAFAVAELVTSSSASAAPLTGAFLRNIQARS